MSRLGFFFLPGAPPGRVLATCQEWRSEEKLVSRESKILSRVAATCHRTENGSFAAGRKVSFPGRVEAAARSGGGGCSVWRAKNTRMPIGARLSRAERSRPCARVPREWPSNLTPGKHRDNRAVTQERVDSRPGSHPVDGRRPLSSTHAAALIRKLRRHLELSAPRARIGCHQHSRSPDYRSSPPTPPSSWWVVAAPRP